MPGVMIPSQAMELVDSLDRAQCVGCTLGHFRISPTSNGRGYNNAAPEASQRWCTPACGGATRQSNA